MMIGRHRLDYSQIRIEDVPKLSKHHQKQYKLWEETKKQKNKTSTDFLKDFTESCEKYIKT